MTILALDWNATRVRAVVGEAGSNPLPVALEPPALDLPMAISLEKFAAEVGGVALRMNRTASHLVCQNFLHHLTDQAGPGPRWQANRHSFDARDACALVWHRLNHLGTSARGIVLTVPSYLLPTQATILRRLGERGHLPLLGSIPTLLTAALAAHAEPFWQRSVLVIDADNHAVTMGWVKALADRAHLMESRSFPHLGLDVWKERLLNILSDLCVRQHRRDPRDAPLAEQSLYDQLDLLIDAALKQEAIQLGVEGQQWFKNLLVHPEQTVHYCQPLARQIAQQAEQMLLSWPAGEWPRNIVLTHEAGRLPGLVETIQLLAQRSASSETRLPMANETNFRDEDFGEELMFPEAETPGRVLVLPPEGPARAAHGLAVLFRAGALPNGHLETIAPLPKTGNRPQPSGGGKKQRTIINFPV
jgi:hypothetical protein